jgi:hypothetical protein
MSDFIKGTRFSEVLTSADNDSGWTTDKSTELFCCGFKEIYKLHSTTPEYLHMKKWIHNCLFLKGGKIFISSLSKGTQFYTNQHLKGFVLSLYAKCDLVQKIFHFNQHTALLSYVSFNMYYCSLWRLSRNIANFVYPSCQQCHLCHQSRQPAATAYASYYKGVLYHSLMVTNLRILGVLQARIKLNTN